MTVVNYKKYIQREYKQRNRRNTKKEMFDTIIKDLEDARLKQRSYSVEDAIDIANKILNEIYYYDKFSTPIFKIAEDFGIKVYETKNLEENVSGTIFVGGTTKSIYHHDKVIFVDEKDILKHQRFVVAHELGHYLFDYLGNPLYNNGNKAFTMAYPKGTENHNSETENRADRFAAELLMPAKLFIEQYNKAMNAKNNRAFTIMYLSEYFQTKISSIEKRIIEVLQ